MFQCEMWLESSSNGEQEIFVNGASVLSLSNLEISVQADTKIYGIFAQTFFVSEAVSQWTC